MKKQYCKNCGEEVTNLDAGYCKKCGKKLDAKKQESFFAPAKETKEISHWNYLTLFSTALLLIVAVSVSGWLFIRPAMIKENCASKTNNLYQSIIKIPAYSSYPNGYGGLTIYERTTPDLFSDSSGESEIEQTNKEIQTKDNYFACLKDGGI